MAKLCYRTLLMNIPYESYSLCKAFKADWKAADGNSKSQFIVSHYRFANWLRTCSRWTHILGIPYLIYYKFFIEWVMGIEIPCSTRIGAGLVIHHGHGIVINNKSVIGNNCTLFHAVTLGIKTVGDHTTVPRVGDNVMIGAGSMLLGDISIGNNSIIGAMSLVTKDAPPNSVVAGNPATIIKQLKEKE